MTVFLGEVASLVAQLGVNVGPNLCDACRLTGLSYDGGGCGRGKSDRLAS